MIGIAFGIDDKKQEIGDVLISESIVPYNNKRVGDPKTIHRSPSANASKKLVNRFNHSNTWAFPLPSGRNAKKIIAQILSGEELIDNLDYRNQLLNDFPSVSGGEMEGAGLYAACDGNADWILVKGICDFADGKKGLNKNDSQNLAAHAAVSLCVEVFSSKTIFQDYDINPFHENDVEYEIRKSFAIDAHEVNEVLFDIYDIKKEKFYIKREQDDKICSILKYNGIWIYGPSGCGKTNAVLRTLVHFNKDAIQVSLANYTGAPIDHYFYEILFEIKNKFEPTFVMPDINDYKTILQLTLKLLTKYCNEKECYIYIEEIPISSEQQYKEFTSKYFSLLINKGYLGTLTDVKFILSSILNPQSFIGPYQLKIHQQLKFFKMDNWELKDIDRLVEIILSNLKIPLAENLVQNLTSKSKGSPRFIKKYFRNVVSSLQLDENGLVEMILETERELKVL